MSIKVIVEFNKERIIVEKDVVDASLDDIVGAIKAALKTVKVIDQKK
jgi:hypothetical protein